MLITDKTALRDYGAPQRLWQGIPGIEITKKGRIFVTFYSGGTKEEIGNYCVIIKSDDSLNFSEPILVCKKDEHRCFDPCLWIDPLDRLWFTWSEMPGHSLWGAICDNPDADDLIWSEPFLIGHDVMMNKPTVLSTGEWLFPVAVWNKGVIVWQETTETERGSFAYKTADCGKTFEILGRAEVKDRSYDEHMIYERQDGSLAMLVRTTYGIGVSYSYDKGKTWTEGVDSLYGGPNSRFHIRRLKSGRLLLINHVNFTGRNNLTALLSEDDGKTWKYSLLIDGRDNVSYPDMAEKDGYLYIVYDRERGGFKNSLKEVYSSAREILIAKITEDDIIAGKIVSPESKLGIVASKLGEYAPCDPFAE